jgi:hypothetical protein
MVKYEAFNLRHIGSNPIDLILGDIASFKLNFFFLMNNNNNNNINNNNFFIYKNCVDLNQHMIITRDLCIHIQKSSLNVHIIKKNFLSVLSKYSEGDCYTHVFNLNYSSFPANIGVVTTDTCDKYVSNVCLSIELGFLSVIDNLALDNDDNFYVFISKDYNSKLELMII